MDPLLSWLQSTFWGSATGWTVALGFAVWVTTGFTTRGWTTAKQRERQDGAAAAERVLAEAAATKERGRADELQKALLEERKETADKALEAVGNLSETARSQQGTISEMDGLFRKIPVVRGPISGGTVDQSASPRGSRVKVTE